MNIQLERFAARPARRFRSSRLRRERRRLLLKPNAGNTAGTVEKCANGSSMPFYVQNFGVTKPWGWQGTSVSFGSYTATPTWVHVTNVFTAPQDGTYLLSVSMTCDLHNGAGRLDQGYFRLIKADGQSLLRGAGGNYNIQASGNCSWQWLVPLGPGEVVRLEAANNYSTTSMNWSNGVTNAIKLR